MEEEEEIERGRRKKEKEKERIGEVTVDMNTWNIRMKTLSSNPLYSCEKPGMVIDESPTQPQHHGR